MLRWVWLLIALFVGPQESACHGHRAKHGFGSRYDSFSSPGLCAFIAYRYISFFFLFLLSYLLDFSVSLERQWAMEENTKVPISDSSWHILLRVHEDPEILAYIKQ